MLVPGPRQGRVGRAAHWGLFWLLCFAEALAAGGLSPSRNIWKRQFHSAHCHTICRSIFWEGFYSSAGISQPSVLPAQQKFSPVSPLHQPGVLLGTCACPAQRARWQMINSCGKIKWSLRRLHVAGIEKRERKKGKGREKRK